MKRHRAQVHLNVDNSITSKFDWVLVAGRRNATTVKTKVFSPTNGGVDEATGSITGTPILNPNQPLAIGTNKGSSTFTGILNIAWLEDYDSYLSDDDLTYRAETIRSLGLLKGIAA